MKRTLVPIVVAGACILMFAAVLAPAYQNATPQATGDDEPADQEDRRALRKLTDKEINRLRFMELLALRRSKIEPDKARVQVPRDVADDFLTAMQGREGYKGDEDKRKFLRQSQEMKLAEIAYRSQELPDKGAKYIDRIEIRTDPEVFQTFRTKVMPYVLRGCATSHCHGGAEADKTGLHLLDDPKKTAAAAYTNFLLLDEIERDHHFMIDRDHPADSLVLAWMLPANQTEVRVRHPGSEKIKPLFQNTKSPAYKAIVDWIADLRRPRPDYGVRLHAAPPPATAPAGEMKDDDHSEDR